MIQSPGPSQQLEAVLKLQLSSKAGEDMESQSFITPFSFRRFKFFKLISDTGSAACRRSRRLADVLRSKRNNYHDEKKNYP
jgi:hypothetical protein